MDMDLVDTCDSVCVCMVDASGVSTRSDRTDMEIIDIEPMRHTHKSFEFRVESDLTPPSFRSHVKPRKGGGHYNDEVYRTYRDYVRHCAKIEVDHMLTEGPAMLWLKFFYPLPKRVTGLRKEYLVGEKPQVPYYQKPDIDNITKTIMDALEGIAYRNDAQISQIVCEKVYHRDGEGIYKAHIAISGYGKWEVIQ